MLNYKGYTGHVEFDDQAGIFHGEVLDLRDVVTFQGKSVDELEQAFKDSVDDYLEFCQERNEEPDRPFSGKLCSVYPLSFTARFIPLPKGKERVSTSGLPSDSSAPVKNGS